MIIMQAIIRSTVIESFMLKHSCNMFVIYLYALIKMKNCGMTSIFY